MLHVIENILINGQQYTIMDFYVSVYDVILTYYGNIDRGGAEVNIFIVSQYHIIYTDLKVHNCFIL